MSYWVDVTPVVETVTPWDARWAATSDGVRPSTVKLTMPHRSAPRSWTVTPGTDDSPPAGTPPAHAPPR